MGLGRVRLVCIRLVCVRLVWTWSVWGLSSENLTGFWEKAFTWGSYVEFGDFSRFLTLTSGLFWHALQHTRRLFWHALQYTRSRSWGLFINTRIGCRSWKTLGVSCMTTGSSAWSVWVRVDWSSYVSKECGPFVKEMPFKNAVRFHNVQDGEAAYNVVLYLEQLRNGGVLGHLDPLAFVCQIVFLRCCVFVCLLSVCMCVRVRALGFTIRGRVGWGQVGREEGRREGERERESSWGWWWWWCLLIVLTETKTLRVRTGSGLRSFITNYKLVSSLPLTKLLLTLSLKSQFVLKKYIT